MRSWGFAVVVVIAACGPSTIPLEDWGVAKRDAECAKLTRCSVYETEGMCARELGASDTSSIAAAVAAGVSVYDPEAAAACVAELAGQACGDHHDPCAGVVRGTRGAGDSCSFDGECAAGRCDLTACDSPSCCVGTCSDLPPRAGIGEACDNVGCVDVAWCDENRTCRARLADGERCDPLQGNCALGSRCEAGRCRVQERIGDPCNQDTSTPTCWVAPLRCDPATLTCVAPGFEGDACDPVASPCADYLICDPTAHTCRPPIAGDPCPHMFQDCDRANYCAFGEASGTCTPKKEIGQACEEARECRSGRCAAGACAEPITCY